MQPQPKVTHKGTPGEKAVDPKNPMGWKRNWMPQAVNPQPQTVMAKIPPRPRPLRRQGYKNGALARRDASGTLALAPKPPAKHSGGRPLLKSRARLPTDHLVAIPSLPDELR